MTLEIIVLPLNYSPGIPGKDRTLNLRIRSPMLYPVELRVYEYINGGLHRDRTCGYGIKNPALYQLS